MNSYWKFKTCETCSYQIQGSCRLVLPIIYYPSISLTSYPQVSRVLYGGGENIFMKACSKYDEEIKKDV